jgi:hypothetical protein
MLLMTANDFLASTARQLAIPFWAFVLVGVVAGAVVDRLPKIRNGKASRRWLFAGLIGGLVGAIAWCVAYFFFHVDLS